jgi:hypothetical protein
LRADEPAPVRATAGYYYDMTERHEERHPDLHRDTVISAEMRHLERRLLAIGPMSRERLAAACAVTRWREGSFEAAVKEGVRQGRLKELPLGWLEAARR